MCFYISKSKEDGYTTMLTAITIQCHVRRPSPQGGNDSVSTEATIGIRMQTIANQLSNNNHKSP